MKHGTFLTLLLSLVISINGNATIYEITQQEAFKLITNQFKSQDVDYYYATHNVNPIDSVWTFFVDADPNAQWSHDCYLINVPKHVNYRLSESDTRVLDSHKMDLPPADYDLVPYSVKERYIRGTASPIIVQPNVNLNYTPQVFGASGNTYAILISGCDNRSGTVINYSDFWNECSFMYQTLTKRYNVPKNNIYPLISDGNDPAPDMLKKGDLISTPLDLDFDGQPEIELAATKDNLISVLSSIESKITSDDQLFIFITNHGGYSEIGLHNSSISHSELKKLLNPFSDKGITINIVAGSCHSGGICSAFSRTKKCVVATSCAQHETAHLYWPSSIDYATFLYYWICAVNGYDGKNKEVNSDLNKDGIISMEEAFDYARRNINILNRENGDIQTPQFLPNPKKLGESLAFNNTNITITENYKLEFSDVVTDNRFYDGTETKTVFWNNPDIVFRRVQNNDDSKEFVHQNPVFDGRKYGYLKVKVRNNGEDAYITGKSIFTYLAQASTNIEPNTWLGKNKFFGYDREFELGKYIRKEFIPKIEPGDSIILYLGINYPEDIYDDVYRPNNHNFCFFTKIVDDGQDKENVLFDPLNDRTSAMSNISIIDKNDSQMAATVFVNNGSDLEESFSLELGFRTPQDRDIFKFANIVVDMSKTIHYSWYNRGGGKGNVVHYNDISPYTVHFLELNSSIDNIVLAPHSMGRVTLHTDFFKAPFSYKTYTIDLIQRDSKGKIVGGETFVVNSPKMALTGLTTDSLVLQNGIMELSVVDEDASSVKWFTSDNNVAGTGRVLHITPEMRSQKYSAVTTNQDGELMREDIAVYSALGIHKISPEGNVSDYIDITMQDEDISGYIITVTSLVDGTEVYRAEMPAVQKNIQIDMTPYPKGIYVLNCRLGETILNTHKFTKR